MFERRRILRILLDLDQWLRSLSTMRLTIVVGLSSVLVLAPLAPLLRSIVAIEGPSRDPFAGKVSVATAVLWLNILTPILETIIFQWAVLRICRGVELLRRWPWIACVISAFLFGLAHGGGLVLFTATFAVGLVLAYGFLLAYPTDRRAFIVVAGAHALHNAIALLARTLA